MIELGPEEILFIISIIRRILDPQQVGSSAAGTLIVEAGKSVLSRLKKPLPTLSKVEFEALMTEIKEELVRRDLELALKIDEIKTEIANHLEVTIRDNEAVYHEIRKNMLFEQEILSILKELEEKFRHEQLERLNKPWTERPARIMTYTARKKEEQLIAEEVRGDHNIICIEGIPGSGKSYLMTRFYEEVEKPKKAFWCQIREDSSVDTVFEFFSRVFYVYGIENIRNHLLSPDRIYQDIYDDLRRNFAQHEFFFFLDNFHLLKDEQFVTFLKNLSELKAKSKIILATREAVFPRSVRHKIGRVTLQGFTRDETRRFLREDGITMEDDCFQLLYSKTNGIPMIVLLVVQKLKDISKEEYSEFVGNLPNRDIEEYLMETVHEILDPDEKIMLQVLSVLRIPEPLKRISLLCTSIDTGNALTKLENRFLAMRDISDGYFSHDIVRYFYLDFMEMKHSDLLCRLCWKAYEMYYGDFEAGEMEAGEQAIEFAEAILGSCEAKMSRPLASYVPVLRNRVANGFLKIYRPRTAIRILDAALEDDRRRGDLRREARDLNTLANAYLAMNENSFAIQFVEKALGIDREIGDRRSQAIDMNLLGKAWLDSNDPQTAREYLEKALEIDREIGDRRQQAIDMNLLGKVSRRLKHPTKAIEYYEGALQISREIGDTKNISYNLHSLGHLYLRKELYVKAEQYFRECIQISFETNRYAWIGSHDGLGDIYDYWGESEKALISYEKALEFSRGKMREILEKKIRKLKNFGINW